MAVQTKTALQTKANATFTDLYKEPGKAELVNGKLVQLMPTGGDPGYAADEIFASLREYAKRVKVGRAVSDNKGFRVNLPNRESFSPDAAFYIGTNPGMKFYEGAPIFAVEVRSETHYGPEAELAMAQKRGDYFAADTQVVWDIDLLRDDVIKIYTTKEPNKPMLFRKGELAHAEPALVGWDFSVDGLFPNDLL
jgi:Uma2 family endonuclease